MAKARSHLMSTIRGSIAGITYTANGFQPLVMRNRTVPVQPVSNFRNDIKAGFASGSLLWEGLTDQQRFKWTQYAQTVSYEGPLGWYQIPARQLFIGTQALYQYYVARGLLVLAPPSLDAPTNPGAMALMDPVISDPSAPAVGIKIGITNLNGEEILYSAQLSFKQSAARNFYKGPWDPSSFQSSSVQDTQSGIIEFEGLDEDGVYFARLKAISAEGPFRIARTQIIRFIAVDGTP